MKKVFSKEKFIDNMGESGLENNHITKLSLMSWVDKCEGLTKEEAKKINFELSDDWLIEVEDDENAT